MGRRKQINNPRQSAEGELNGEEIQEIVHWLEHRINDHWDQKKDVSSHIEDENLYVRIQELEMVKEKLYDHLRNR